jgi:hypothetical protein
VLHDPGHGIGSGAGLAPNALRQRLPSTIMHATHNGIIQAFFNRITADTGPTAWFIGEFGVAGAVHRGSCLVLLAPPADVGRNYALVALAGTEESQ